MDDTVRWSLKVSRETDEALRVIVTSVGEPRRVVCRGVLEVCCRHQLRREPAVEDEKGERERNGLERLM